MTENNKKLSEIISAAKTAAISYYKLTGKPLGITGEIAECEAARLMDLELAEARSPGYDAIDKNGKLIQIKARRIAEDRRNKSQRVGSIRLDHKWDSVMLVLMDEQYDVFAIYEAEREAIKAEIERPGSVARNERGALPVSTVKRIGKQVWPKE